MDGNRTPVFIITSWVRILSPKLSSWAGSKCFCWKGTWKWMGCPSLGDTYGQSISVAYIEQEGLASHMADFILPSEWPGSHLEPGWLRAVFGMNLEQVWMHPSRTEKNNLITPPPLSLGGHEVIFSLAKSTQILDAWQVDTPVMQTSLVPFFSAVGVFIICR